ncbi:MAG: hypothetical protein IJX16_07220 [Clostridia bacterium]|nr:hypothetical protein [Clostridia bacterium]
MVRKIKYTLVCVLTAMMILSAVALSLGGKSFASADLTPLMAETELFLPKAELEYYPLNNPTDTYSDENLTAIVQNNELVLCVDGKYQTPLNFFENLKQVKRLNQTTLLVSDNGSIYSIEIANPVTKTLLSCENSSVGGNYFDVNSNYVITAFAGKAFIYNSSIDRKVDEFSGIDADKPITLNENNEIFYIDTSGQLCKRAIDNISTVFELATIQPYKMIADNSYVYYVLSSNSNVFRRSISSGDVTTLSVNDTDYDLGKPISPSALAFKNGNLLITDATNSIQEFMIDGDNLVFTGFAIAEEKTAFNRIDKKATEIEKYGNSLAVLDGDSLLVVDTQKPFDSYDTKNFKDYSFSDLGFGELDNKSFALGCNTALLSYKHNSSLSELKLLNLADGTLSEQAVKVFDGNIIRDICYQSGKYYVLADDGSNNCKVFVSDENELNFGEQVIQTDYAVTEIAVDVFGNVYLLDEINSKICKYTAGNFGTYDTISYTGTIKKLSTDLGGALFTLIENKVFYLDKEDLWQEIALSPTSIEQNAVVKSFAMDFISQEIYFIYEDEEFIYKTEDVCNLAISSLDVPDSYVTTNTNADFNSFKVYKPTDTANVYSINKSDGKFEYKSLVTERAEYALITEIVKVDSFGRELKMLALAGQDDVVLINANECQLVTVDTISAPQKAFITTAVHMYYLPISTADDGYALSDTTKIRLNKNTEIAPQKEFTFLGNTYYFASVSIEGVEYLGYIPKNFTVEVLSENFEWDSYTRQTVNKTDVYSDGDLEHVIGVIESGTEIRVFESDGSICKIAFLINETDWAFGYISASVIQDPANVAIRNILIILAVTACVCGTTSYFLLRRKK